MTYFKITFLAIFFFLSWAATSFAQSTEKKSKESDAKKQQIEKEYILDDILIEGVIQKPNVAIFPTRARTKFGEIHFINRAFGNELKAIPSRAQLFGDEFKAPIMLAEIKKFLAKKKK